MTQPELNLRDYLRILRKHRFYLIAPTLLLGILTYLLTPTAAITYRASASIKISQSSTLAGLMLQVFTFSSGDNLATQTQIITSLPLVARLAQNLGRIPADMSLKDIMAQPKMVAEIGNLKGMVSAEQTGNTSIVQISANANSSREAKDVANGLADAFVAWSIEEKNRQVIEAKDFIGQQLGQAEIRLKGADDELQTFQEQHLDELSLSPDMMSRLQQERESIRQRSATLGLQVKQLRARGSEGAIQIDWISSAELNNPMLEKFNTELIELQLQKERLLVYQTNAAPEVRIVENKIQTLVSNLSQEFDVVIFDSPPALPVTDAAILASQVDGVVLIYQMGRAGRGLLKRAKSQMEAVQANIRGVVLNDIKAEVSEFSPAEYYYQYYASHGQKSNREPESLLQRTLRQVLGRTPSTSHRRRASSDSSPQAGITGGKEEYEDVLRVTEESRTDDNKGK